MRGTSIKAQLASKLNVAYSTIVRWYYKENDKFARLDVIQAITELTGLTQEEIFETEK